MSLGDTTMGGAARAFPSTQWNRIVGVLDLGALFRAYWKPVYASIRLGWRKSNEDAKDQTQAFFTHLLENGSLQRIQPDGGSFRAFLKQALKNFLIDAERSAEVRRAIQPAFSLEADAATLDRWSPAASAESPERVFDREWLACLLDVAVARLEQELAARGKAVYFEVFRRYVLDPAPRGGSTIPSVGGPIPVPSYAALAAELGIKETDVRNYLNHCRPRLREILQEEIRATVESDRDAEDELRSLLAG